MNINTQEWDNTYSAAAEVGIGKFFKRRAINASRFYELVIDKKAKILDIGCGTGKFLTELSKFGYTNLFGIEPDPELTRDIPREIIIKNCGAEAIDFEDNSFDVIYIYGILHHLKNKEAYEKSFSEIDRLLKTGGLFFVMEPGLSYVYKTTEFLYKLFGKLYRPLDMLGRMIEIERKELYCFMQSYKIYEKMICDKRYQVIVNRKTPFISPIIQWIMTAKKY